MFATTAGASDLGLQIGATAIVDRFDVFSRDSSHFV